MPSSEGQKLMMAASEALRRRDYDQAEPLSAAAYSAYPAGSDERRTAMIFLGKAHRQRGRYEEAIAALEQGLPFPGAFSELVSIYRFLAKAAKKEGDVPVQAQWLQRMYSLSMIYRSAMPLCSERGGWARAAQWIGGIRAQCGTIYAYQYDGQTPRDADDILSEADYRAIRSI